MRVELAWVDALLSRWGRWAIRCESGALGFAASCVLGGDLHTNEDGFHSAEPRGLVDDDMEAVDGAVRRLPDVPRLVVIRVYQFGYGQSDRALAAMLGMSRQAFREYLLLAHRKIALDISVEGSQNQRHSVNGGIAPARIQPVPARA